MRLNIKDKDRTIPSTVTSMSDSENNFLNSSSLLYVMDHVAMTGAILKNKKRIILGYSLEGLNKNSSQFSFVGMSGKPSNDRRHLNIVLTLNKGEFLESGTEVS